VVVEVALPRTTIPDISMPDLALMEEGMAPLAATLQFNGQCQEHILLLFHAV
jgi:hypothetical protein